MARRRPGHLRAMAREHYDAPMKDPAPPIAAEAFAVLGTGRQVAPFSSRHDGFDLPAAYRAAALVHEQRLARGEKPVGRKIGFTNRTIWAEYDVWAPIWGHMYDRTVHDLASLGGTFALAGL